MSGRFYIAFLPWAVFDIATRSGGIGVAWGSAIALAAAAFIALSRRHFTAVEVFAVALFSSTLLASTSIGLPGLFTTFARVWSTAALGLFALLSVLFYPFSQQYTRDLVARPVANSMSFRSANIALSVNWGLTFVFVSFSHLIGTVLKTPASLSLFHWFVPIALVITGCSLSQRIWNSSIDKESAIGIGTIDRLAQGAATLATNSDDLGSRTGARALSLVREVPDQD